MRSPLALITVLSLAPGCGHDPGASSSPDTGSDGSILALDGGTADRLDGAPGDGPAAPLPDGACVDVALRPAPTDVLWLLDTSGSWQRRADRYQGMADALQLTLSTWSGVDHALLAFPRTANLADSCDLDDYRSLDVGWGAPIDAIARLIGEHTFSGGSTLGPALQGALADAAAVRTRGRTATVILLTDASPQTDESCASSDWEQVAQAAAGGLHEGVHTHVLSVVSGGISPDHFARIGAIATAGDGFAAIVNGSRQDVAGSSARFLASVRDQMEVCTYTLPPSVQPSRLVLREGSGNVEEIPVVDGPEACNGQAGFYFDDPRQPSTVTLCSGPEGVGGLCQRVYLAARTVGRPIVSIACR